MKAIPANGWTAIDLETIGVDCPMCEGRSFSVPPYNVESDGTLKHITRCECGFVGLLKLEGWTSNVTLGFWARVKAIFK